MARKRKKKGKGAEEHGVKDVSGALAGIGEVWGDTDEVSFEDVEDGKYQTRIDKATVNHSKSSGRLQCSWELTVVSGKFRGRKLFKHDGLDDEQGIGYFKGGLARLGIEAPKKSKDLPGVLDELKNTFAQVTARTRPGSDIQNVYFDKALDSDDVEDVDEEVDDEEDEDEDGEMSVGTRVSVEIDGEDYEGKVTKINEKKKTASIKFDDGDKQTVAFDDITVLEDEDEEDEEDEDEEDEEEETEEEVEVNFEEDDLTKKHKASIKKLAKKHEFDPDDYESQLDLICDIAEYCGVEGSFDKPTKLIKAIQEAGDEEEEEDDE